jgi:hypothetical protein
MQNFANAAFSPDVIAAMISALEAAVANLPDPVHTFHVNLLAESILCSAGAGERDPATLQRLTLIEVQLARRD